MCGILLFYNPLNKDIYDSILKILIEIQNSGKDSCGIYQYNNNNDWDLIKRYGTIKEILNNTNLKNKIRRNNIINIIQTNFFTNYSNCSFTKSKYLEWNNLLDNEEKNNFSTILNYVYLETQPLISYINKKPLCIVHDGNINIAKKFATIYNIDKDINLNDTQIILEFIKKFLEKGYKIKKILKNIIENIDGIYNFIIVYDNEIYIVRDSLGILPLTIGIKNEIVCICSESSVLKKIGLEYYNEVLPGEILRFKKENNKKHFESIGIYKYHRKEEKKNSSCTWKIFEKL